MAYTLQENIAYAGNQPNFARDRVKDLAALKAVTDGTTYDIGHIVYCSAEKKHYKFVGVKEEYDEATGYFRLLIDEASFTPPVDEELVKKVEEHDSKILSNTINIESNTERINYLYENGTPTANTFWVGDEAPQSTEQVWLDTSTNDSGVPVDELLSMQNAITALQKQVNMLMTLKTHGVVAGNMQDSTRKNIMDSAEPEMPKELEGVFEEVNGDDDMTELEPDYDDSKEPTVTHIAIKTGTLSQIQNHMRDYVNGELLWCSDKKKLYIYQNGIIIAIGGNSGSSEGDSGETDDNTNMDKAEIMEIVAEQLQSVESIGFVPVGSETAKYTVKVNEEGRLICYNNAMDNHASTPTQNLYYSDSTNMCGLLINSFYLGGIDNDKHSYQPCSHNFVELSNVWVDGNGNQVDINLNGFYLFYMDNGNWQKLKLWGTIPAGGTFLIRGAQCSVMDANTTVLKVRDYDMQWMVEEADGVDDEGNFIYKQVPIKFSQDNAAFYIAWADVNGKFYNLGEDVPVETPSATICPIDVKNKVCAKGFVDLTSYNHTIMSEDGTYTLPVGRKASEVIFRRWYPLDMVTQSNPDDGVEAHSTRKFLTATYLDASNIGECSNIEEFTPKCSWEGKTIANTRSIFESDRPTVLTNTFGIQATDNGNGASRGFCWVSVGYYDEFLYIRKKGENNWLQFESIRPDKHISTSGSGIRYSEIASIYPQYYMRMRWETSYGQAVTTHKVLLSGLKAGEYEYKVVRKGDSTYAANLNEQPRKFKVYSDEEAKKFTFVQTTDQQGATWEEYEVWNLSARVMKKEIDDPNGTIPNDYRFVINTGDICYNGNRSNEWIDYFRGYEPLNDREEMLTIGNNDLIPPSIRDLGNGKETPWKINPNVHDYFYATEMDPKNPPIFTDKSENGTEMVTYRIPSLYSFNFGEYHFVSVLSEMRTISNKITIGDDGSVSDKKIKQSTVNTIFGIKDELRKNPDGSENRGASKIYDIEEEWMIKDMMVWKGIEIPADFERNAARYHEGLVGQCQKCIVFTHEMPFNIISDSAYGNYTSDSDAPRETAKAYLNRYHNFEYQRLWKLWGILLVMGGHKHTCALTRPVYDAPLTYNPITKRIAERGPEGYKLYSDDILNDIKKTTDAAGSESWDQSGMFSNIASFQPFIQVLPEEFENMWKILGFNQTCNEVYNNSSVPVTVEYMNSSAQDATLQTISLKAGKYINDGVNEHPKVRIELVDAINSPSYIMCQATGFKNKSNSDLASKDMIPWERFYVKGDNIKEQCYPFYTVYNVETINGKPQYTVKMYLIEGMYESEGGSKNGSPVGYWNLAKIYNKGLTLEENRDYYTVGLNGQDPACKPRLYNAVGDSYDGTVIKG